MSALLWPKNSTIDLLAFQGSESTFDNHNSSYKCSSAIQRTSMQECANTAAAAGIRQQTCGALLPGCLAIYSKGVHERVGAHLIVPATSGLGFRVKFSACHMRTVMSVLMTVHSVHRAAWQVPDFETWLSYPAHPSFAPYNAQCVAP